MSAYETNSFNAFPLQFATGSGVSPMKAVIESGALQAKKRKHVRLFYGTKSKGQTTMYIVIVLHTLLTEQIKIWYPYICRFGMPVLNVYFLLP